MGALAAPQVGAYCPQCKSLQSDLGMMQGAWSCGFHTLSGSSCQYFLLCFAGNESHAGQVFTCVAALAVADSLHLLDRDLTCWWCANASIADIKHVKE